jgi:hypothetical protein
VLLTRDEKKFGDEKIEFEANLRLAKNNGSFSSLLPIL